MSKEQAQTVGATLDLATALIRKRQSLGLTQAQASRASGIPYGTYIQAETYARMGPRVRMAVHRWVHEKTKPTTKKEGRL